MARLMTLREVIGRAQIEIGIALVSPSIVIGSKDQDVLQMAALLHGVADEVLDEMPYKVTLGDRLWCASNTNPPVSRPAGPQADTDLILFDGRLAVAGLKMRFRAAKGLEFGEDMRDFSTRLSKLALEWAPVIDTYAEEGREI